MKEEFVHFIWQYQLFAKGGLSTTSGAKVSILHQGHANHGSGPDFHNAKVLIDGIEWAGHVELHKKSSDWQAHSHHTDPAYCAVVLHVVWESNGQAVRADGTAVPEIELKPLTDGQLLGRYQALAASILPIPCGNALPSVDRLTRISMFDQAVAERLHEKGQAMLAEAQACNGDWEEASYRILAKNFGFKTNQEPFLALARALPLRVVRSHAGQPKQVEALLFGQAGLLNGKLTDIYYQWLQREYRFLAHKYALEDRQLTAVMWKTGKLRPAASPFRRIAQLAAILSQQQHIFSKLLYIDSLPLLMNIFSVTPQPYWQEHHNFGKPMAKPVKGVGSESAENIIINTVCPLLAAYGQFREKNEFLERAVMFLEQLDAENNKTTRLWETYNVPINNAFDSQASIGLYNSYCTKNRCLSCKIGNSLLRK